ncbi:hypothetical protein BSKO_05633 [Bryopsis sp. KO-2023]|nr:hypothetical protein BSKO_05633 [Bryopsis sp. KO-2023]
MVLVENYAVHHENWAKCFNDPKMSDVVFESKDGQTFHCEKFVLEVASPFFKKLFSSRGASKLVSATDVDSAALKWILRACYTGDGDLNDDNVVGVMVAAKMYEMEWVEKACMKYLKRDTGDPLAAFRYSKENEKWQEWKVPESGWYHLVAVGAKAADQADVGQPCWSQGGMGAMIGGSFELHAGDVIQILTGGMSRLLISEKYKNEFTGGGGGTFLAVKQKKLSLLLAAGGGGGISRIYDGHNGSLDEDGGSSDPKHLGGKKGGKGAGGGGGLGWNAGPVALAKPKTSAPNDTGGFGGGGNFDGGGGGYSGGSNGTYNGPGGGGSYVAPQAKNVWKKVGSLGHGKAFIWRGKNVPDEEMFFLKEIGSVSVEGQINDEPLGNWEVLERLAT